MITSESDVTIATAAIAMRTDIYERNTKGVFMSLDDIETLENRVEDRNLFRSIGIGLISGSSFLGLEKGFEAMQGNNPVATGLFIVCLGGVFLGVCSLIAASRRTKKIENYKKSLFASNRIVTSSVVALPTGNTTLKVVGQ